MDSTGRSPNLNSKARPARPWRGARPPVVVAACVIIMVGGSLSFREVQAAGHCGTPGAKDYCASYACGPCDEGEGDCDPGQCATGLECVEEGDIDHCWPAESCGTPGAKDYCASYACGTCEEGEGDCDPGQCASGLECVEEGAIDACRATDTCGTPGAGNYCASDACGPCEEGEGDCDPGQCATGLGCVEEGAIDTCHPVDTGVLEVWHGGVWRGLSCNGGAPGLSDETYTWTASDRFLTDETAGMKLDCFEGNPQNCTCNSVGERMHGIDYGILQPGGSRIHPDYLEETCLIIEDDGDLATDWTSGACPNFRLD